MMRKVYNLLSYEANIVFIPQIVDLLLVIHDEERLRNLLFSIILNVFLIIFEGYKPTAGKLKDLFLRNLIRLGAMELDLVNFLCVAWSLGVEDSLVVAADDVSPQHGFRFTNDFEDLLVERSLYDTVIVLDYQHVLLITTECLSD